MSGGRYGIKDADQHFREGARIRAFPKGERQGRAAGLALSLLAEQRAWEPDDDESDERWMGDGFLLYDEAVGPGTGVVHRPFKEDIRIVQVDEREEALGLARELVKRQRQVQVVATEEARRHEAFIARVRALEAQVQARHAASKPKPNPRDPFGKAAKRRERRAVAEPTPLAEPEHQHVWRAGAGYIDDNGVSYVTAEVCKCGEIREVEPPQPEGIIGLPEKVVTIEMPSGLHRELPVSVLPKEKQPDAIFEPPPPPPAPPPPPKGKWERLIDAARSRPGEWARTPWSMKEQSAKAQASGVRNGRVPGKPLPGTEMWEATAGEVDGHWYVWVRFMGEARLATNGGTA